jgi:polysaccharide chain length determinant protein (PEP-CTERM system associated)
MQVADRLASLFIQENVQDRSLVSQQTAAFLDSQVEEAGRKLTEQEARLQAFRIANAGTLPSQMGSTAQMMQATQAQLQGAMETVNRNRDRQLTIEREIADLQSPENHTTVPASPGSANGETRPATAAEQLAGARAALAGLELRLKPSHPDVQRARRVIAELERKVEAEASNPALATLASPVAPMATLSVAQAQRLSQLRNEYESLGRRIATSTQEQERLEKQLTEYRHRLEGVPSSESQLSQLMRDYETIQDSYRKLLAKSQDAKVAADLERRQIGQQFRIIDGARLPERPFSPDRMRVNLMGTAAGFGLGLALIVLLEYRDSSFHSRDDIVTVLALPVLAVVPRMTTAIERNRVRRRRMLAWSASAALVLIATGVAVWRFQLLDAWVR